MRIMDAARYFIYLSYDSDNFSLTPLKLQKLLYFAQGWSCVWDKRFLFNDEFEAWQYGPVNREVYDAFKRYRGNEIPRYEGCKPEDADELELETIETVWENYGFISAGELVEMTHAQKPWKQAYNLGFDEIDNEEIEEFFLQNH